MGEVRLFAQEKKKNFQVGNPFGVACFTTIHPTTKATTQQPFIILYSKQSIGKKMLVLLIETESMSVYYSRVCGVVSQSITVLYNFSQKQKRNKTRLQSHYKGKKVGRGECPSGIARIRHRRRGNNKRFYISKSSATAAVITLQCQPIGNLFYLQKGTRKLQTTEAN